MVRGESPRIMFDVIMGRFEDDYNPNIFYAASCRLKEFGLNREPRRFQQLLITTDPVHCVNHTRYVLSLHACIGLKIIVLVVWSLFCPTNIQDCTH